MIVRRVVSICSFLIFFGSQVTFGRGIAVEGFDSVRALPPPGATVSDYRNTGYELRTVGDEVFVTVGTKALESHAPFTSPPLTVDDPIQRLATALVTGARTEYDAVSRLLAWVANHIEYELDRKQPQNAHSVLERRSGYCTGVARLTVALLNSVDLEAREVAGYVIASETGRASGFHRWIEVRYSDRGWVFSDPLTTHHYVPATYIRLASDHLEVEQGVDGLLLDREDNVGAIDVYRPASDVMARRNREVQLFASLRVTTDAPSATVAILEDRSNRWTQELVAGRATFVGLEPGNYTLRVVAPDRPETEHQVRLADRVPSIFVVPETYPHAASSSLSSR